MATRDHVITLKLSEFEDKQFKKLAATKGLPVSNMIRMLVAEAALKPTPTEPEPVTRKKKTRKKT